MTYKVEYIQWDTSEEETQRLIREAGLDPWYVNLVKSDYKTTMVITGDGILPSSYTDAGEPEDQTFCRDWSWVKSELERAYEKGRMDAFAELKGAIE